MADRKKKIYGAKDSAPRKPVILKPDRETPKDQAKEKQEKEKQPTIILKTREQSTPKDERPQSPRSLAENEPQPSKIVQNESKEKKIMEKPPPPLKQMKEPIKLIDENMELITSALEYMNDSNTSYLVIGIMGMQGVGKSMIMNLLAHNQPIRNLCQQILNSHEILLEDTIKDVNDVEQQIEALNLDNTTETKNKKCEKVFKFKMQDIEQIERGVHCTKGIDMFVTEDRVILLDCQALWSPSLIDEASSANPITSRSANVVTVDCLQLASYMMSVCHVLIAVQDWFCDYNFVRYIQAAEMLKPTFSSSNTAIQEGSETTQAGESNPHLLLLHNRCQLEDYTPDSVKMMQDFYRNAFQKSNLQLNSGMYLYSDSNKNGLNIDSVNKNYDVESCGLPLNLFLLPEIYENYENTEIYRGHPSFEILVNRLKAVLLGVERHQITNVPNLSEKGWFQYCGKAWETIRKCTFFMEYERLLP